MKNKLFSYVCAEVEAELGTVLGAEVAAEGYRKLLTRQSTAAGTGGGGSAGVGAVRHQVHIPEGAGAEAGGAEAAAPGLEEQEEGWGQQAGWRKTTRGRRQVLEEDAPAEEAVAEQAGVPEKAQAQSRGDKEAAESYEKMQMLWKGIDSSNNQECSGNLFRILLYSLSEQAVKTTCTCFSETF